jgi:predicted transposase/invertase (TIGR01784 family)
MSHKEIWTIFFKYAKNIKRRKLLNEILQKHRGVSMATNTLLKISKDEIKRYRIIQEEKKQLDYISDINSSFNKGKAEGIEIGEARERNEAIRKMIKFGVPTDKIAMEYGLTVEAVNKIK